MFVFYSAHKLPLGAKIERDKYSRNRGNREKDKKRMMKLFCVIAKKYKNNLN